MTRMGGQGEPPGRRMASGCPPPRRGTGSSGASARGKATNTHTCVPVELHRTQICRSKGHNIDYTTAPRLRVRAAKTP